MFNCGPAIFCPIKPGGPTTANVLLLMHFDSNPPWLDQVGRTVTTNGTVSTFVPIPGKPVSKFGSEAAGFPGGFANYLTAPGTPLFNFGTSPWVIDCWVPSVPATGHPNYIFAFSKDATSIYPLIELDAASDTGPWFFTMRVSSATAGSSYTAVVSQSIPNPGAGPFVFVRCGRIDATTIGISINGAAPTTATISSTDSFTPNGVGTIVVGWTVNGDTSVNAWSTGLDELCVRSDSMNSTSFAVPTIPWVYP